MKFNLNQLTSESLQPVMLIKRGRARSYRDLAVITFMTSIRSRFTAVRTNLYASIPVVIVMIAHHKECGIEINKFFSSSSSSALTSTNHSSEANSVPNTEIKFKRLIKFLVHTTRFTKKTRR